MNRSSRRRKRNRIDIPRFFGLIIQSIRQLWAVSGGPYIIIVTVFLALVASFIFYDISLSSGRIHSGVTLSGFDVGNMTEKEAIKALKITVAKHKKNPVKLHYKSKEIDVVPTSVVKGIDYTKSVEKAYDFGRKGDFFKKKIARIKAYFSPRDIKLRYQINKAEMENVLVELADGDHRSAVSAEIVFKGTKAKVEDAKNGYGINSLKAEEEIIKALIRPRKIVLRGEKLVPAVSRNQAKKALPMANQLVSQSVSLVYGKNKWILSKNDLLTLFETKIKGKDLVPTLSKKATLQRIAQYTNNINQEPRNAELSVSGAKVDIIASQDGRKVYEQATYENVLGAAGSKSNRIAEVVVKTQKPARTTQKARKMGVKELVTTFTTYYPAGKPRVKNIHLLAELLDGTMIAPGDTFSFNGRIGKRTPERGFVAAPEIRNGEFVETVGGGICQVSTTTFNAALLAGFPIGQRNPHSLFIKKYPPGRDAAVSFPSPDLTFTNDTKTWILIKGGYTSTSISISFYGTDYGRKVSFETKLLSGIPYPTEKEKDPTLEKGKEKEEQKGVIGKRYLVVRTVKDESGKVTRTTEIRSTYNPVPRKIKVGTKKKLEEKEEKTELGTGH